MTHKWLVIFIITFCIGVGMSSYLAEEPLIAEKEGQQPETSAIGLTRTELSQIVLLGENNKQVNIFNKQDSRIRVLYFGFTRCPDVCPTSLAMLSGALNQVTEKQKSQLRPMFVSLDPERDEADASHQYAQYFHPMIEGLSASLSITTSLANHYGAVFRKTQLDDSEMGYTLDHNSYFYFLQADGRLITKVPHTSSPAPIVAAINDLIKNTQTETQEIVSIKGTE